jgi:hypothetical protein
MALFQASTFHRHNGRGSYGYRRGVSLPSFMKNLNLFCTGHAHNGIPVPMRFIGADNRRPWEAVAVYACPVCNWRAGQGLDPATGKIFRRWSGFHDGR